MIQQKYIDFSWETLPISTNENWCLKSKRGEVDEEKKPREAAVLGLIHFSMTDWSLTPNPIKQVRVWLSLSNGTFPIPLLKGTLIKRWYYFIFIIFIINWLNWWINPRIYKFNLFHIFVWRVTRFLLKYL